MPVSDSGGGSNKSDRQLVKQWSKEWAELDSWIKANEDSLPWDSPEMQEAKEKRRALADKIVGLVETKDHLWDVAVNTGFNENILEERVESDSGGTGSSGSGSGGGSDSDGSGGGDGSGGSGDGKGGKGGGGSGGKGENRNLPGVRGKDYELRVGPNGKVYAIYKIKIKGKVIPTAVAIDKADYDAFGVDKSKLKELTKGQFQRVQVIAQADELALTGLGGERHPFEAMIESITNKYGGTGLLKNKEVLGVLINGVLEGWGAEEVVGALEQTKWYRTRTDYQVQWATSKKKDREATLATTRQTMEDWLEGQYGEDWRSHVDQEKVDRWVLQVASGRYEGTGEITTALQAWQSDIERSARDVMGTPAQVGYDEQQQGIANSDANPAVMYENLREQAVEWLGYTGLPAQDRLEKWAGQLAAGEKSQVDFENYLKRQKQALFPYLDPDETWMDASASYKNAAESILGSTLSYEDALFKDFMAFGQDGKALDRRMSIYEFENRVRQDARFKTSSTANEEAASLGNFLTSMFTGGGGF